MSIGAFGKAVAPIAKKIGEEVVEGMAKSKASKSVAKSVDDWGWKGGKPGEITGGKFTDMMSVGPGRRDPVLIDVSLYKAGEQLGRFSPTRTLARGRTQRMLEDFELLERADIPRKWTGKVMSAFKDNSIVGAMKNAGMDVSGTTSRTRQRFADSLSSAMRPMTNAQRETFLSLLPEWAGSIDDLAKAAKLL